MAFPSPNPTTSQEHGMNCPRDNSIMELLGSMLTRDQQQVMRTWICLKCLHRRTERVSNPNYLPMVRERETELERKARERREHS